MFTTCYTVFLPVEGANLFTVILLPQKEGRFPVVLMRSPYVDEMETMEEQEILRRTLDWLHVWPDNGYAVVWQHCRGRGKSTGDCIPFLYEREDGLALQEWVRRQPFYNGELYLYGASYTSSVHYVTAPFAPDIKGAVLEIMDTDFYHGVYRNGVYKAGLHGMWYAGMYKNKSIRKKNFSEDSFRTLPLSDFPSIVFDEPGENLQEIFCHPCREDPFWNCSLGGQESREAIKTARIPILLVTGFYDIFVGGMFRMWNSMKPETRERSALLVCPYDHPLCAEGQPLTFPNGAPREAFEEYAFQWVEHIRKGSHAPIPPGQVTYYRLFENVWRSDSFLPSSRQMTLPLGKGTESYVYNPYDPARFKGGLSTNFGGAAFQDPPGSRYDILTVYSGPFPEDRFVKGRMSAQLQIRSDCDDTCFYIRVSLAKEEGDYGLRDDIRCISDCNPSYRPGDWQKMEFSFDEHAFLIRKGERIRVDVSSAAFPFYVPHTNYKGLFSQQRVARPARNSLCWDGCVLTLPLEGD